MTECVVEMEVVEIDGGGGVVEVSQSVSQSASSSSSSNSSSSSTFGGREVSGGELAC